MKIAIYAGMFKKNQDGATKSLYELTDSLLNNNIETGIWGFSITPQQRKGLSLFQLPSIPLPLYPEYRLTSPTPTLKKQLLHFNPDVIHVAVPDLTGLYFIRCARQQGIPVISSFHTDFPSYLKYYHLGLLQQPAWKYLKWFYNQGDAVFAPTEEFVNRLKQEGVQHAKTWARGIHLDKYNPRYRCEFLRSQWGATGKKVILFCGRFVWYKNLEAYIHVYQRFKKEKSNDTVFVLAGDGPIRDELKKLMPDAHFPGYLQGDDLSRVYASSDILLFPSTTEAFGNVVLEALASGVPAVVSNIGGCKEIVRKSQAGLVTQANKQGNFFGNCKRLVEDGRLYQTLRQRGLAYAENQSWKTINNQLINQYRRMMELKKAPLPTAQPVLVKH